jgi:adenosine deaminase
MPLESFVREMPKVALDISLEGSIRPETLRHIADQNNIRSTFKQYNHWLDVFANPDYQRMEPLLQTVANWFQQPEDLTRIVYDLGVDLAKQNVRYAEIGFIPTLYNSMTFEQVLAALNDGRSRVERGWNVRMSWILQLPRNQIRRVDDVIRWATSNSARNNGIVGIGLIGRDDLPPVDDFEKPFQNAHKKGVACAVSAGDSRGGDGILSAIHCLNPARIIGGWGTASSPAVRDALKARSIGLVLEMSKAVALNQISAVKDYPAAQLYQEGISIIVGSGMPTYFRTSLTQEYLHLIVNDNFDKEMLRSISLNAVHASMLDGNEKTQLANEFDLTFETLSV